MDKNIPDNWYESFFSGINCEMWEKAATKEWTDAEVAFLMDVFPKIRKRKIGLKKYLSFWVLFAKIGLRGHLQAPASMITDKICGRHPALQANFYL